MEGFVTRALKKIRDEGKKNKELRALCEKTLEEIRLSQEGRAEGAAPDEDASKYFEALRAACESRLPRAVETALDCLQKLIAYDFLKGECPPELNRARRRLSETATGREDGEVAGGPATGSGRPALLLDVVVETICQCGDPATADEGAQLQTIKALLTAVSSSNCQVHEATLLTAVRACYHIHLASKNQVNKVTAKAGLQQMLAAVFQRMEAHDKRLKEEMEAAAGFEEAEAEKGEPPGAAQNGVEENKEGVDAPPPSPVPIDGAPPVSEKAAVPTFGENMYPAVAEALGFRLGPEGQDDKGSLLFPTVYHKDAFLIFRALCKLSMRSLPDDPSVPPDHSALQSKLLSLELLLSIMEGAGPCFRTSSKFVYAVRHYLCSSLLKNCTHHFKRVVSLSLRLFVTLISHFKDQLKSEIEVFISNVFLKILESENSTFDHKILVLEVFCQLCEDPTALVEIFLNYDCDLNAIDLFQRIVIAMSKVAKGVAAGGASPGNSAAAQKRTQEEDLQLKKRGLEGLLSVLTSLLKTAGLDDKAAAAADKPALSEVTLREQDEDLRRAEDSDTASLTASVSAVDLDSMSTTTDVSELERPAGPSAVVAYDKKQKLKEEFETGILKFNLSPYKGVEYLASKGHFDLTPQAVAAFLHEHKDTLDKTQIGELLGKEKDYKAGFGVATLHAYVDMLDFEGMLIDEAIRHFLHGFRLPGEAQKIDRMMEKFAERYCLQNSESFVSADTAFILAFAIIMLNTDLHNPNIPDHKKMTKDGFKSQNRGISNGGDLPEELLFGIYDRIKAEAISLKEDDEAREKAEGKGNANDMAGPFFLFGGSNPGRRKRQAFNKERLSMVRASEALFKQRRRTRAQLSPNLNARKSVNGTNNERRAPPELITDGKGKEGLGPAFIYMDGMDDAEGGMVGVVQPMFEVAWWPIIGSFSQALAAETTTEVIQDCLQGLRLGIHLSSLCGIPTARETFINGLTKYTMLDTLKEMEPKNIECIKTLLTISLTDGNYLMEHWYQVLRCISQLGRLHLFASGLRTDDEFLNMPASAEEPGGSRGFSLKLNKKTPGGVTMHNFAKIFTGPTPEETAQLVDSGNAKRVMGEVNPELLDKVYTSTIGLNSESIRHFVTQLCRVSQEELTSTESLAGIFRSRNHLSDLSRPRMFSLQKLVEVADFNMDKRSRLVWDSMWQVLSTHFAKIGLHGNTSVAIFAVDSLRQLSSKFLEKTELNRFNFQRLFLQPFEEIMARSKSAQIRQFVTDCTAHLIGTRAEQMRSAWQPVFKVLVTAAQDSETQITQAAFAVTDTLLMKRFDSLVMDFVDLVNCLMAFGSCNDTEISLKAVGHAETLSQKLNEGKVDISHTTVSDTTVLPDAGKLNLWWPLLLGLSTLVADKRAQVRLRALTTLCRVIRQAGVGFVPQTWEMLFRGVLIPIMENAWIDFPPKSSSLVPTASPDFPEAEDSWIMTTAPEALASFTEIFLEFFAVCRPLLAEMLQMLQSCICQEVEFLARAALDSLEALVKNVPSASLGASEWGELAGRLAHLTYRVIPVELAGYTQDAGFSLPPTSPPVYAKTSEAYPFNADVLFKVTTPYGDGEIVSEGKEGGVVVQLNWGATLYSPTPLPEEMPRAHASSEGEEERPDFIQDDGVPAAAPSTVCQSILANREAVMTKAVAILRVQKLVGDLMSLHGRHLSGEQVGWLVDAVDASFESASTFNANLPLRGQLALYGFLLERGPGSGLPHLLDQECQALCLLLHTFIEVEALIEKDASVSAESGQHSQSRTERCPSRPTVKYQLPKDIDVDLVLSGRVIRQWVTDQEQVDFQSPKEIVRAILSSLCHRVFNSFVAAEQVTVRCRSVAAVPPEEGGGAASLLPPGDVGLLAAAELEVAALGPVVLETLTDLCALSKDQLMLQMKWLYPPLINLIRCQSTEIRDNVVTLLELLSPTVTTFCQTQPR